LLRLPYFWEDDVETYNPNPRWHLDNPRYHVSGLKIFNFHPLLVYLNCRNMDGYEQLKKLKHLPDLQVDDCAAFVERESGTATILHDLIRHIRADQKESFTASDLAALWDKRTQSALKV
jgi:hypothetical protein